MLSTPILLDYQSSTPCLEDVVNSMEPYWSKIFSNPSSSRNVLTAVLKPGSSSTNKILDFLTGSLFI